MNLTIKAYFTDTPEYIVRKFRVNDLIRLDTFCEYTIVSMNGLLKEPYALFTKDDIYLCPGENKEDEDEKIIEDETLRELTLTKKSKIELQYGCQGEWDITFEIIDIKEGYLPKDFEIISAKGKGILEGFHWIYLSRRLYKNPLSEDLIYGPKKEYLKTYNKVYTAEDWNGVLKDYQRYKIEKRRPKNYRLNVSLVEFNKEIKRKFLVNSNMPLNSFCKCIVRSMRGDLFHSWGIRIRGEYLEEHIVKSGTLDDLDLKEKQKFFVVYDFGDNWEFEVTVSRIFDHFEDKMIELIDGKGYGIIEDCCGAWRLLEAMEEEGINIQEFDLEETKKEVDQYNRIN